MSDNHELEQVTAEPIPDPGLPEHEPRPTDVDPKAERRAERQVSAFFGVSVIFSVLFCVVYLTAKIGPNTSTVLGLGASNVGLGTTLGLGLLCIGIGAILWARKLMGDHEIIEYRHSASSPDEDREEVLEKLNAGIEESGIARRPLIRNSLLAAVGALGLPAIFTLKDLGTPRIDRLKHTAWTAGMALVVDYPHSDQKIRASDMVVGQLVNAAPANVEQMEGTEFLDQMTKAAIIVVKIDPSDIRATQAPKGKTWDVNGVLAYSKICTHVGCAISLWEHQTHHLLCPCHQSTFDLADAGKVVFGPAARPLPQLPITVDADGYLIAQSDFQQPVGPSFWERS
ncbi:MAG TPA: Rieske 2Fe-2S domain-containing protein [Marmoricola sp.]|nr:Rieske 2Fe-2S domain-containing protein [Marmoricola sp.]